MQYKFENEENVLTRFRNMIQKVVPEFDDQKQYVLWLVPDFYLSENVYQIEGTVHLYDRTRRELDLSLFGLQSTKCLTRTPYYNKRIRQVGLQKGRSRIYGIPLIFNDYRDMLSIQTIHIHWDILVPQILTEDIVYGISPITLDVIYHVNFNLNNIEKNHWFTLSQQDNLFDEGEHFRDKLAAYYDTTLGIYNYYVEDNDGEFVVGTEHCQIVSANNETDTLSEHEENIVNWLNQQPVDTLIQSSRSYEKYKSVEWDMHRYYYEKAITLEACPYADIIPESGFGFKA